MTAYGTDEGFTSWLTSQGLTLPVGAPAVAVLRQVGSSYVDAAYSARLTCSSQTGGFTQVLAWPRTGHYVNGQAVPDDLIPQAWINASYRAGYLHAVTPGWATASSDPNRVTKREKVDMIEREFFASTETGAAVNSASGIVTDAVIDAMLAPWLCSGKRRMGDLFKVI